MVVSLNAISLTAPETDEMLVPLKVTPRCTPVDRDVEPGVCIFTGKPTRTRGIFAKSY